MKKKTLTLISLMVIVFFCCCKKAKKTKSPYFEGLVESTIHIQSATPAIDSFIYKRMGNYVTTYIKDSFVSRIYYSANNIIVAREIYRSDSLKLYQTQEDSDTITVTDLRTDYYYANVGTKEIGTKKIMGKTCLSVLISDRYRPYMFADPSMINVTYYFDTSIQISPLIHHNVKYGSYDRVFSKYHYLTAGYEFTANNTHFLMEARRIVSSNINPIVFEVPKNKIRVDAFLR